MAEHTDIAWSEATFNAWIGCTRVSAACDHCYAETLDKRAGGFGAGELHWGDGAPRKMMADSYWRQPLRWARNARERGLPILVFCSSLADVFEDRPELVAPRARLFELIEATPSLIWQLLTKRPQNVDRLVPAKWMAGEPGHWPSNCWIGTTAEDQPHLNVRARHLCELPAPVRFLSCEPLLGPLDLSRWLPDPDSTDSGWAWECQAHGMPECDQLPSCAGLQWIIVGGESGPGWRPMDPEWARSIIAQCEAANVPVFYKQDSALRPAKNPTFDGRLIHQFPKQAHR